MKPFAFSLRHPLELLLSVTLALSSLGAGWQFPSANAPDSAPYAAAPGALVQVDLPDEGALVALAQLGLPVYAQLYPPQGGVRLLLPADPALRRYLKQQGYPLRILDPDTTGASYSLLSGAAAALARVSELGAAWPVGEGLAVARLEADRLPAVVDLSLKIQALALRPLAAPPAERLVKELDAAPQLAAVLTPDPLVTEMINQVSTTALYNLTGDLSGEWPALVEGAPYTIATRYTYSGTPINKATRYVRDRLLDLGLTAGYHYYTIWGSQYRNVVAEQTGLTQPSRIYLVTAHLDSITYTTPATLAPGADDNASGSVGVLTAAEILSQYAFGCTLRYVFFTGEEQWLYGSAAYASDVSNQDIEGVLNLDMIGFNTLGSAPTFELHTRPGNSGDLAIANLFQSVVSAYGIGLTPRLLQDGENFSDHSSFWNQGFPAILAIEDWNDHTPNYHKNGDQLETLDMTYFTNLVKASVATFAHMGCLLEGQLSGVVRAAATGLPLAGAQVQIESTSGKTRTVYTQADGSYAITLPPGLYGVTASKSGYLPQLAAGVTVSHGQATSQNFSLATPCAVVAGLTLSLSTGFPATGQTVSFNADVGGGATPITYTWNFGDGASASGAATIHAYAAPGVYTAWLTADNACGVPQTVGRTLYVGSLVTFFPLLSNHQAP